MAVSKEQWEDIAHNLTYEAFEFPKFKYKEHEIVIAKIDVTSTKAVLVVFIDGDAYFGASNPTSEQFNPLSKLFWYHINHKIYNPKEVAQLEKSCGKRQLKRYHPEVYSKRYDLYTPEFKSLNSLIRQFKKVDELEFVGKVSSLVFRNRGAHDQKPTC